MKNKRGQQDIIVTVLLVLIALAAVALVATFVVNNVKKTTQTAEGQITGTVGAIANCTGINLEVTSTSRGTTSSTVTVSSKAGTTTASGVRIYVNGVQCTNVAPTTGLAPGESKPYTITWGATDCIRSGVDPAVGATVSVAAVVGNAVCEVSTVTKTI
jgi:hypothetical protein